MEVFLILPFDNRLGVVVAKTNQHYCVAWSVNRVHMVFIYITLWIITITIVDIVFSQWEYGFHRCRRQIFGTDTDKARNTFGIPVVSRLAFMVFGNRTGVTRQVKLYALIVKSPPGGPQSSIAVVVHLMANSPGVANRTTQRSNDNETCQNSCSTKQTLQCFSTTKSRGLPCVVEQSGHRLTINFVRRAVVPVLHCNFFWHHLFDDHYHTNAETQDGKTRSKTK